MLKVYRLLRNNQELGPYSLEELLQHTPKPTDLVWVEGKSASWAYPYEIDSLKAYVVAPVPQVPVAPSATQPAKREDAERHIFVRLPEGARKAVSHPAADPLEARAEALRQRVAAQAGGQHTAEESLQTRYNRSINDVEEEYTHWYYRQKTKPKKSRGRFLVVTLVGIALLTGGYFTSQLLLKSNTASAVQQLEHNSEETARAAIVPVVAAQPITTDTLVNTLFDSVQVLPQGKPAQVKKDLANKKPNTQNPIAETTAPLPAESTATAPSLAVQPEPEPVVEEAPAPVATKKRGGFLGLFRKKEKEPATTEPEPAGGRKAKRRDGAAQPVSPLVEHIELRSDATRESWMLGVMGQKLTLVNHNPQPVGSASVEVSYYGEDKTLLEKKTIRIANIAAKGQATAALPDNRVAERVSLKVLSAEASVEK